MNAYFKLHTSLLGRMGMKNVQNSIFGLLSDCAGCGEVWWRFRPVY